MATNNRLNYAPTNHAVIVGGASGAITSLSVGTDGQLLVGTSSADPAFSDSANADFTFGGTNSGATRTLTVSNTSNTASSMANALVTVGGGTAADATMQSVVSGVTTWTMGVDNSNADIFAIAGSTDLGTTDVMQVQTTGEINYPLQSAFLGVRTNSSNNVTGDGTVYTFTINSEIFDQNSDFDGTSTYTAPVTGTFSFFFTIECTQISAAMTSGHVDIVTSNRTYVGYKTNTNAISTSIPVFNTQSYADMDAADTATATLTISNGLKAADIVTTSGNIYFGGFLVC